MSAVTSVALELGMTGAAAGVGALINGLFNRRSRQTSDADTLTDIAMKLIKPVSDQLEAVTGELAQVKAEFAAYKTSMAAKESIRDTAIAKHVEWDNQVSEALRALGHEVPVIPPLSV